MNKKPAQLTPKSKKYFEALGYVGERVEYWESFSRRRKDLFGFGDLLMIHPESGVTLIIQVCATSSKSSRRKKILSIPLARQWLLAGNDIIIHHWEKVGNRWESTAVALTLDEFPDSEESEILI